MNDQVSLSDLAAAAKALAHPARLTILRALAQRACCCGDLVAELPLAQSTVSQHLKVLKAAGLVVGEPDGPRSCYGLNGAEVRRLRAGLDALLGTLESGCCCDPTACSCCG